ncbi:MAG: hypothetical protein SXQ77_02750 [Halobacteria archaeon]|nr:hypothetical protein [Halobacteria archaeon]
MTDYSVDETDDHITVKVEGDDETNEREVRIYRGDFEGADYFIPADAGFITVEEKQEGDGVSITFLDHFEMEITGRAMGNPRLTIDTGEHGGEVELRDSTDSLRVFEDKRDG